MIICFDPFRCRRPLNLRPPESPFLVRFWFLLGPPYRCVSRLPASAKQPVLEAAQPSPAHARPEARPAQPSRGIVSSALWSRSYGSALAVASQSCAKGFLLADSDVAFSDTGEPVLGAFLGPFGTPYRCVSRLPTAANQPVLEPAQPSPAHASQGRPGQAKPS